MICSGSNGNSIIKWGLQAVTWSWQQRKMSGQIWWQWFWMQKKIQMRHWRILQIWLLKHWRQWNNSYLAMNFLGLHNHWDWSEIATHTGILINVSYLFSFSSKPLAVVVWLTGILINICYLYFSSKPLAVAAWFALESVVLIVNIVNTFLVPLVHNMMIKLVTRYRMDLYGKAINTSACFGHHVQSNNLKAVFLHSATQSMN